MSFSSEIKEELSKLNNLANKEIVKAELIGYLISGNTYLTKTKVKYSTENEYNINRYNKLLKNLNIEYKIEYQGKVYIIEFNKNNNIEGITYSNNIVLENIIENENISKSIVRGAFLGAGSLNNPKSKYHLEIILNSDENAKYIESILNKYGIKVKILKRKEKCSIYIKDGEEISKILAFIGSNKSVLKYEEIRVEKETRNNINRLVNCETANLNKTINAAVEQIEAIKLIKKKGKFSNLDENLKEIATLRIENPELSLVELGKMLKEPVGKSGVNYRLKKIIQIANELNSK